MRGWCWDSLRPRRDSRSSPCRSRAAADNADGSRAGLSTVDTTDDIHAADKLPYGLGVRVPMYVISPWSRGGWVNSQVFDHTSIIRFLEKRFGVIEPNITAWRRAVCGDLTSAFDFASPNTAPFPSLPDTSRAAAIVKTQGKRPPPAAPATPERLFQEPGTRRSRALPYEAHVHARVDGGNGTISLTFRNTGQAAMVFHVYDKLHPERVPRVYTVETGKTLIDHWDTGLLDAGAYDLWICGVNGYCRAFKGNVHAASGDANPEVDIEYDVASRAIRLKATNTGQAACVLTIRPNAYRHDGPGTLSVAPGMAKEWQYSLTDSGNWYDFTVTVDNRAGFMRRSAGRMEIGAHGVSDPAMA
ncbi:DUF756 domain-containing protein [Cupriavidus basilensis]|uniref:DUF756 domain-containing protein n=1 Tax=Cupriavidus basilensis TaxID=68895 RepID=A0ABT6B312_9BURK|nr:phospholipase domain-containing protein [Cupriavidus basilensis]MDF3839178.1 DUF756 domain-containing protein [Cupriavidus basilensis]